MVPALWLKGEDNQGLPSKQITEGNIAEALQMGWPGQGAELWALIQALKLQKERKSTFTQTLGMHLLLCMFMGQSIKKDIC